MKFTLLIFYFTLLYECVYAQRVELRLIDSISHMPLEGVHIAIYSRLLQSNLINLATDSHGKVLVQLPRPGIIDSVVIESYPYQRIAKYNLNIVNDTVVLFYIQHGSINLEEIQVGFRGRARLVNNKIIYHPHSSAFNKTRSVSELMPMIPNIAVRNGRYFFRNDDNFVILIDGMGENKSKEEQLNILRNMPVDAIHKVEIIDNPSARYRDGTAAVINFLTKKDIAYTSLRGSASSQIFHGGNSKDIPKSFNVSADSRFRLGGNNLHFIARVGDNRSLTEVKTDQSYLVNYLQQKELMTKNDKNSHLSFIWDRKFSENFTTQINTSYTFSDSFNRGQSEVYAQQLDRESSFFTSNSEQLRNSRFTLTPQFKYSFNNDKGTILYMNPMYASLTFLENNMYANLNDDVAPIMNSSLLEMKTDVYFFDVLVDNLINNKLLQSGLGYKYNSLQNEQKQGGDFSYKEWQQTVFLTNAIKVKKATINADIRMEHLNYTSTSQDTSATYTLNLFYPKINVIYPFADQKNITVGYERQVLRLSSIALNPQTRFTGFQRGITGNVDLQPRLTDHYFARMYLNGHSVSINYKRHRNQRIFIPINEVNPFISEQTTYNYFRQYYISYNKSLTLARVWEINSGLYYYINDMRTNDFNFINTSGDNLMVDVSNDLTFGKNKLNLNLSYMSSNYFAYGEMKPVLYNSMNYSRLFFGDNLGVSFFINDFLGVTKENSYNYHPFISSSAEQITNQRSISLQLSYRIPAGKKSKANNYKTDRRDEIRL
ncbi:hypothetical protein DC487_06880 [Sphingobacterium corticibacter]|uniref:Outer membrane protein beta-barrel domain-containing protein n=2 Tax=Sphingobacterium corticibacter TaxID=2171749 RepID=A0A2T8HJP4_9SPHI|nr:hypothetical protein DC487_06880 [Sphingobacterium corticibacter]